MSQCPSPPLTMWMFPSGGGYFIIVTFIASVSQCVRVCMYVCMYIIIIQFTRYNTNNNINNKYTIFNEPLQREPAAPVHSVASRQLTGGNIVHLVLPRMIVSGANSAICSNRQKWKQPPGPIHHMLPLQERCKTIPFHCMFEFLILC